MKNCLVGESPLPTLLMLAGFITSFAVSVNASGAYMSALRARRNNTMGTKSEAPESISDFGMDATIPQLMDNPHLEIIDEKLSKCNGIDIREITIAELHSLFATNMLTSVDLTKCYLERIQELNRVLGAVIEVNQEAVADALRADLRRNAGKTNLGLMHGVPILIKENIATNDMMETTAGSLALVGIRPRADAACVKALRKSGAVILGKASLSEFAYFRGTNIPSGWSGRGGYTRNAYCLNVSPEGSSSGSAVAISANLATVSIGTETDGSLLAPSSIAGICTIKPTAGMLSTKGVIPISHNQDTVGPMARTVMDLAILLDALTSENDQEESFTQRLLQKSTTTQFRVGVLRHPFWNTSAVNSTNLEHELPQLEQMLNSMKLSAQFAVMDPVAPTPADFIKNVSATNELIVLQHDFKHDMNEYLRNEIISPYPIPSSSLSKSVNYNRYFRNTPPRRIACLEDIINYNRENPSSEGYNQELLILSQATDGLSNETYIEARDSNRAAARELLDSVLEKYNLDAIVTPSESRNDGMKDEEIKDSPPVGYSLAAISGYPSVNIPAGIGLQGVPFGITFMGRPNSEGVLLEIAYAVEQMSQKRRPPQFLI